MSTVITSGPASRRRKTRSTEVIRHPFYVSWDNGGEGGWRYLPVDTVHQATIAGVDEFGNPQRPVDIWTHKGFIPVEMVPEGDPRFDKLPLNWRDHALFGADPEWRNGAPKAPAVAADPAEKAKEHWAKDPSER